MPSTRKLNADYELTTSEAGHERGVWRARGDIIGRGEQVVATVFGEGATLVSAEDDVWHQAEEWVRKRGRRGVR